MKRNSQTQKPDGPPRSANRRLPRRPSVRRSLSPRVLKDIIARVVAAARPQKIILFGSAARGTMGPNSDVDLLVVKRGRFDRGRLTEKIYLQLCGAGEAVDVIVVTPDDVEQFRDTPWSVVAPALREGRVVYAA
jgi:predicted nucleotidyltransferase